MPNQPMISRYPEVLKARYSNFRVLSAATSNWDEDSKMGKEKNQFQLKTPKGTKDCNDQLHISSASGTSILTFL